MDEPLARYCTFHIGGNASYLVKVATVEELIQALRIITEEKIPYIILGGGTNVLIGDKGFRGVVIKNDTTRIKLAGMKGEIRKIDKKHPVSVVCLEVDSGVGVNRLVRYTLDQGLTGLEAFLGQPGTIGGALFINAHNMKMGKFFGDTIVSAKIFTKNGVIQEVKKEYFAFGYDQSKIQSTADVIISAVIKLEQGNKEKIWGTAQSALEYRQTTQPQGGFCAGCVFANIQKSEAMRIATPSYSLSAGYLIDQAGLRGKRIGGAQFSSQHANFIVTKQGTRASDVLQLIALAKKKVAEKFGITLKEEIILVGDF